jgi:hypothetical protein
LRERLLDDAEDFVGDVAPVHCLAGDLGQEGSILKRLDIALSYGEAGADMFGHGAHAYDGLLEEEVNSLQQTCRRLAHLASV